MPPPEAGADDGRNWEGFHVLTYAGLARRGTDPQYPTSERLGEHLALRAEVRGYGSLLNDDSTFLCNPEVCAFRVRGDLLTQWQANIGLTLRF